MVVTVLVPLRRAWRLEDLVTARHFDALARLMVLTALVVASCEVIEILMGLRAPAQDAERAALVARLTGTYAPLFWLAVAGSCLGPLLLLLGRVRGSVPALLAISLCVNVAMWLERFVLVASSLSHDRLPFGWRDYWPRGIEMALTAGAFGWFFFLLLVGLKILPPLSIAELKEQAGHAEEGPPDDASAAAVDVGRPAGEGSHVG
jgi:molybdopterin-containing oxidoreductase family membrane subunit